MKITVPILVAALAFGARAAEQSADATKLVQLAAAADIELRPGAAHPNDAANLERREAFDRYLRAQLERSGDSIDAPPPAVAKYLADNAADIDAIRDHLLGGTKIAWDARKTEPMPHHYGHLQLQRVLIARALDKARTGDAAAWEDLRASWQLNLPLWERPEILTALVALSASRMSNAAMRKMPLPAPSWVSQTFTFAYEDAMARALEGDGYAELRALAERARRVSACDGASPQFAELRAGLAQPAPNLIGGWERVMRFRAERELTERVLQMRAGETPRAQSLCADGSWNVTPTSIAFTREIDVPSPGIRYPLRYAR